MKREAILHTKMKRLCRRLNIPLWQAVGLLESIWHLTAREAPRGDIGKLSDEDIALAIDYRGDESTMVEALVASGWLDRDAQERIVVHDWHDHADDAVQMKLARGRFFFVGGRAPKLSKLTGEERKNAEEFYSRAHDVPTNDDSVRTDDAQNDESCAPPEPVPVPEPVIKNICAPPENGAARRDDLSIDEPQFDALIPPEPLPPARDPDGMTPQQVAWFFEWWALYWRNRAKKATRKAFAKKVRTPAMWQKVKAATMAQKAEMMAREEDKRPYGSSWLNGERWEDVVEPETATPSIYRGHRSHSSIDAVKELALRNVERTGRIL